MLGMPISIMLGVVTAFTLFVHTQIPLLIMPQQLFSALDNFIMLAIPFFILAGSIMTSGTMAERLVKVISLFVGNFFGGLALAGVLGCMFFAALSGSSPATVAAIGTILIPALVKYGYNEDFAVGLITTAGSLGIVIPPSIPMILYCLVMNVSVGKLFMAGIGPGLLIGFAFCGYVYYKSRRMGWRSRRTYTTSEAMGIIREGLPGLVLPIIVLGGIYAGFFTPTEAAAVSVVYALIIELLVHRSIKIKDLPRICKEAAVLSTAILFIIACAMTFIWLLASHEIPKLLADFIVTHVHSWWLFLILINILFLIMGTVMDDVAAMLIMAPLLGTTLTRFNIDPIHFGVVMVLLIEFGFLTPPFGINLFVAMGLTNKPLVRVSKSVIPFIVILLICVFIVTFVPEISLFLPNLFYK
jgi:C4-dicarboxylate transporter DctM subunit